ASACSSRRAMTALTDSLTARSLCRANALEGRIVLRSRSMTRVETPWRGYGSRLGLRRSRSLLAGCDEHRMRKRRDQRSHCTKQRAANSAFDQRLEARQCRREDRHATDADVDGAITPQQLGQFRCPVITKAKLAPFEARAHALHERGQAERIEVVDPDLAAVTNRGR